MENKLEIFKNEQFGEIRTVIIGGEPWFVLKDLCVALSLSNPSRVVERLDDDDVKKIDPNFELGSQNPSNTPINIVNESGMYNVILRSDKPEAKQFKRWLTHEVIPQIRKTGSYGINLPEFTSPALAARAWAEEFERRQIAESQRNEAIRTKAWIGNKREATAMASASVFKRKSDKLEIELDKSKKFATVKLCEIKTKRKFDWHKLRNYCTANELEMKKIFDSNYGEINSYPAEAWQNVYDLNIQNLVNKGGGI
jgi:prophage antirepressor-like protein